jgi:hypothetical protein
MASPLVLCKIKYRIEPRFNEWNKIITDLNRANLFDPLNPWSILFSRLPFLVRLTYVDNAINNHKKKYCTFAGSA